MKKSTCFFICMLAVLCYCSAQSTFGISAGISSALIDAKADGVTITSDAKIGFIGGVTISTVIAKCWSFRPELNFTQKGGAINFKDEEIKDNTTLNYIELPLNLAYSTKGKFFLVPALHLLMRYQANIKSQGCILKVAT
jgi:hypothetical protein